MVWFKLIALAVHVVWLNNFVIDIYFLLVSNFKIEDYPVLIKKKNGPVEPFFAINLI